MLVQRALELARSGTLPLIQTLPQETGKSRATVYRYFPSQSALVQAMHEKALEPLNTWEPRSVHVQGRIQEAIELLFDHFTDTEVLHREVLAFSIQQNLPRCN